MKNIAPELIEILRYLLPGFLMAWVFHGLTPYPKGSEFERTIEALVFNLPIQIVASMERAIAQRLGRYLSLGNWSKSSDLAAATFTAFFLGVVFAYLANCDRCHSIARNLRLTRETSYPSEWFGAFAARVTFIVLHLKDERRLYGWPNAWPSSPSGGHFEILYPSWLVGGIDTPVTGVSAMLINVNDVRWVEFIDERTMEVGNVEESIKSSPLETAGRGSEQGS
jgi:hypothetical protein